MNNRVRCLGEDGLGLPTVSADEHEPSYFRLRDSTGRAARMMVRAAVLVLVVAVVASWAAPKQACASCSNIKWKTEEKSQGVYSEDKSTNDEGCATLQITCKGTSEKATTFIEFNAGAIGGINEVGSQSVTLVCGSDMLWHYQAEGIAPSINTLSCSAVNA